MPKSKRKAAADIIWTADDSARPLEREAWIEAELDYAAKAWRDAQSWPALGEAFDLCRHNGAPIPAWLGDAIAEILNSAFAQGAKGKGGRTARPNQRAYQRQVEYQLYWEVMGLHAEQRSKPRGQRMTLDSIFEELAARPANRHLRRQPDTIRAIYKRVSKDIRNGKGHLYFDGGRRLRDERRT